MMVLQDRNMLWQYKDKQQNSCIRRYLFEHSSGFNCSLLRHDSVYSS
jgi:hypothetical protein